MKIIYQACPNRSLTAPDHGTQSQVTGPPPVLSEVFTCNCVRNPGGNAESNPRPSEEGVSFYHVLRPLDQVHVNCECPPWAMPRAYYSSACACRMPCVALSGDLKGVFPKRVYDRQVVHASS